MGWIGQLILEWMEETICGNIYFYMQIDEYNFVCVRALHSFEQGMYICAICGYNSKSWQSKKCVKDKYNLQILAYNGKSDVWGWVQWVSFSGNEWAVGYVLKCTNGMNIL